MKFAAAACCQLNEENSQENATALIIRSVQSSMIPTCISLLISIPVMSIIITICIDLSAPNCLSRELLKSVMVESTGNQFSIQLYTPSAECDKSVSHIMFNKQSCIHQLMSVFRN